jgi:hypothetical protein
LYHVGIESLIFNRYVSTRLRLAAFRAVDNLRCVRLQRLRRHQLLQLRGFVQARM